MKPNYSTSKVKACIRRMKAMKAAERDGGVEVFEDDLMRACVAVRVGPSWYIVPKSKGGWARRQPLRLTPEAELERLRPAKHISPGWLGILAEDEPQDCP